MLVQRTRRRRRAIFVVMLLLVGAMVIAQRSAVDSYGVVEAVDGDTIVVSMAGTPETVRLIGIDTPETKDPRKPVQCYGPEASAYSHASLEHQRVRLVADPLSTNRDRYDRLLRYVYLTDGTLYNQRLIESGFARHYIGFPFSKFDDFANAQSTAKTSGVGLWTACGDQT